MTKRKNPEDLLKNGRKTIHTDALADDILSRISRGQSLNSICKLEGMPDISTVYHWMTIIPGFSSKYSRAVLARADTLADEIADISDETATYIDEQGNVRVDPAAIQRNKLRVDARKWVACKLKPRVYGERTLQEVSGVDGNPINVMLNVVFKSGSEK